MRKPIITPPLKAAAKMTSNRIVFSVMSVLCLCSLVIATVALAHPGRLDEKGCHHVHEDYVYESGRVLKKGDYHCHRDLGGMRLDGKEMLQSPDDPGLPVKEKQRIEQRGRE